MHSLASRKPSGLVSALASRSKFWTGSGALPMCAMWVGFLSSFLWVGRKKQNKFPSNLHCPIKKLNTFLIQFYRYRICLSSVFLHLLPTVSIRIVADCVALSYQVTRILKRATTLEFTTEPAIIFIHCYQLGFLFNESNSFTIRCVH